MNFDDILAQIVALASDERPEDFLDQLSGAHVADMDIANAKVQDLTTADAERNTEIARLKSHNYDLLMAVQAQAATDLNDEDRDNDSDNTDDDPETPDTDELFEDKE